MNATSTTRARKIFQSHNQPCARALAEAGLAKGVLTAKSIGYELDKTIWIYVVGEDKPSNNDRTLSEFMKLSVTDSSSDPEMYWQIRETLDILHREAIEEAKKEEEHKEERDKAKQNENFWRILRVIIDSILQMLKRLLGIFQ